MHTSPSAQATWGTSTSYPKQKYQQPNFRRIRTDRNGYSEDLTNLERFRRSPAPSVSPTRAKFAAMDHVTKGSVGEEPLDYADMNPTFGMRRTITRSDYPRTIPRLQSRSRSSSIKNTAKPQTFGGAQYSHPAIVARSPRGGRAPYSMFSTVDQDNGLNSNQRAKDLKIFWKNFTETEGLKRELCGMEIEDRFFTDRIFHYIPDIKHLSEKGKPYFDDAHFSKSFWVLQTMIARYAQTYSYEMRAMDVQTFSLRRFKKENSELAKTIDDVVDCRGGIHQFFEEADLRAHLVQAIVAKEIEKDCFSRKLFAASEEEFDYVDDWDSTSYSKVVRKILNGEVVPFDFLDDVNSLSYNLTERLRPLGALSPNPLTTSDRTETESNDALDAIALWAGKLAIDMRVQNATWSFSWPAAFSRVPNPSNNDSPRYNVANPEVFDQPTYSSNYPPIVALALFPLAIATTPSGQETEYNRATVSVRRANGSALLTRPETSLADLIAFEKRHGRRTALESTLIDPAARETHFDDDTCSSVSSSSSESSSHTLESNDDDESSFLDHLRARIDSALAYFRTPLEADDADEPDFLDRLGARIKSVTTYFSTPSTPTSPLYKRFFRTVLKKETHAEQKLLMATESPVFTLFRAAFWVCVILLAALGEWAAHGPNRLIGTFWGLWFLWEVYCIRKCVRRGVYAKCPGLYVWFVAIMVWWSGWLRLDSWEKVEERRAWYGLDRLTGQKPKPPSWNWR